MQSALAAAEERLKDGVSNLASLEEERHAAKGKGEALQVSTAVPLPLPINACGIPSQELLLI